MITCKEIKEQLTNDDIIKILELLGADYIKDDGDIIISSTICHHGDSHKLYYYKESKTFHCYTNCGNMDLFSLIQSSLGVELFESILWLEKYFNFIEDESKKILISDWKFINSYKKSRKGIETKKEIYKFKPLNKGLLRMFQDIYHSSWIEDSISIETMKKYNIKYSCLNQQIVIPHYDMNNNLIGIRARNTLPDEVEKAKYVPFNDGCNMYNHKLSNNLYGLNVNKDCINRKRKVMLVEAEKSVMQCDTMFGEDNFCAALCGSNFSNYQLNLLLQLDIVEVIIALDKQFQKDGDVESIQWREHINKIATNLLPYFKVSYLWDNFELLGYKDSPTDKGKEVLLKLLDNKKYL